MFKFYFSFQNYIFHLKLFASFRSFFLLFLLKSRALQTQIEEKFDIQRTRHWEGDDGTIERYAFLTEAIRERYEVEWEEALKGGKEFIQTPSFDDFKRRCKVMVEQTVGDIFGAMLSQVGSISLHFPLQFTEI